MSNSAQTGGGPAYRSVPEFLAEIRQVVQQGLVDILLASASTLDLLAHRERVFDESHVTPAVRINDTSDVWCQRGARYRECPSQPFASAYIQEVQFGSLRAARDGAPVVNLGLYSMTFNNDLAADLRTLEAFREFRATAERCGFRYFLEVFAPNVQDAGLSTQQIPHFVNDQIVRALADTRRYSFRSENRTFDSAEFCAFLREWCGKYPIISIEDSMADADWDDWRQFRSAAPRDLQIIGDDLFTTRLDRIRTGIAKDAANAVLIKLNQIGTVSETLDAIELTLSAGWLPVVSARSGETEDAFIAHLSVATNAGQLKVGAFSRGERMSKWNEDIRISRGLGDRATFRGAAIFSERTHLPFGQTTDNR